MARRPPPSSQVLLFRKEGVTGPHVRLDGWAELPGRANQSRSSISYLRHVVSRQDASFGRRTTDASEGGRASLEVYFFFSLHANRTLPAGVIAGRELTL